MPVASRNTPPNFFTKGIQRCQQFRSYKTLPIETTKQFSLVTAEDKTLDGPVWPWVRDPIPPGETEPLIDVETGVPTPYTCPAGYYYWILLETYWAEEPLRVDLWIDDALAGNRHVSEYTNMYLQIPVAISSKFIDPKAEESHKIHGTLTNLGSEPTYATSKFLMILEEAGTKSLPEEVTYMCPVCGTEFEKNIRKTEVTCPNGHRFKTYSLREQ